MSQAQELKPIDTGNISLKTTDLSEVRLLLQVIIDANKAGPKSRERSLMITKLEEARLWAGEALMLE